MVRSSKRFPTFAALASILLFSTGGISIKQLPLNALNVAGLRSLVAALFLGSVLLLNPKERFTFSRMNRNLWIASVTFSVSVTAFVFATKLTTAANAIFLQYTMPAWVLLGGAIWLNERITLSRVVTILLCLTGMVLFFLGELRTEDWIGNGVALFCGLTFAGLVLMVRKERDHRPLDAVFIGNLITAVILAPIALYLDPNLSRFISLKVWGWLLWLGVFQVGMAYLFYVAALKGLPAIEVALISLIEPVLNPTWVYLGMGETPSRWAMVGGGIILGSVLIRTMLAMENEDAE